MPFIEFNSSGVCNYCMNYRKTNQTKNSINFENFLNFKINDRRCIFPFSGGRDSSYGLYLAVEELNLKPLTFTYVWGMVTDLARRNISNMCSKLGVENIIVAADISKKRKNIRKNLIAWLGSPSLGMLSMLTAGDKHFFKYSEILSKENNIPLNLWSINPLEVTHFKSGFLGVPPDFVKTKVYRSGLIKQVDYQKLRLKSMIRSPRYFNASIFDTLSGEYYRSKSKDSSYAHLFDYFKWDEYKVETTLDHYAWERSPDSTSSWRIGDGTAAFYNYVYHRVAGFTEHDTFRSNQIREGDLTREEALQLIESENVPRYRNIKWYLDTINLNFSDVISKINAIPRMTN
jgi:glucosamine--fructose-6-phosphate aminotransferase (isomerizing)